MMMRTYCNCFLIVHCSGTFLPGPFMSRFGLEMGMKVSSEFDPSIS